jgi:hypothetical protein
MNSLFDPEHREEILRRIATLRPDSQRAWGKMEVAQMLAHCARAAEAAAGEHPSKQKWIGKLLAPFMRSRILGDAPYARNLPTGPSFVVSDPRDFEREKAHLFAAIQRFCDGGPAKASQSVHGFLGHLDGETWGRLQYKHLDHHLHQFGA